MKENNPNDSCCICKKEIYRKPFIKARHPHGYCKEHKNIAYSMGAKKKAEQEYNAYISRWKNGSENGMRGKAGTSRHIHRYLIKKSNNSCEKCGWSQINSFTGKVPIEINHIDGDYKNNKEENLELLCPNCHSLTSNYKGANKGKGRPHYYKSGG